MEKFYSQDVLVGIKVNAFSAGTHPITEGSEALQVLALKHPKGTEMKIHDHTPCERVTHTLEECLIVRKGKIMIKLYDRSKKHISDVTLTEGELFILSDGIWSVHFLEDSEVIEMKNGPYKDDKIAITL